MVKANPHYPVSLIVVGAGSRGVTYASYALQKPDMATVVAVAEPRQHQRQRFATQHRIKPDAVYSDWKEIAAKDRFADAVIIAS